VARTISSWSFVLLIPPALGFMIPDWGRRS
jgi:hypothetical protein